MGDLYNKYKGKTIECNDTRVQGKVVGYNNSYNILIIGVTGGANAYIAWDSKHLLNSDTLDLNSEVNDEVYDKGFLAIRADNFKLIDNEEK